MVVATFKDILSTTKIPKIFIDGVLFTIGATPKLLSNQAIGWASLWVRCACSCELIRKIILKQFPCVPCHFSVSFRNASLSPDISGFNFLIYSTNYSVLGRDRDFLGWAELLPWAPLAVLAGHGFTRTGASDTCSTPVHLLVDFPSYT